VLLLRLCCGCGGTGDMAPFGYIPDVCPCCGYRFHNEWTATTPWTTMYLPANVYYCDVGPTIDAREKQRKPARRKIPPTCLKPIQGPKSWEEMRSRPIKTPIVHGQQKPPAMRWRANRPV
jgi:hypothetical protein